MWEGPTAETGRAGGARASLHPASCSRQSHLQTPQDKPVTRAPASGHPPALGHSPKPVGRMLQPPPQPPPGLLPGAGSLEHNQSSEHPKSPSVSPWLVQRAQGTKLCFHPSATDSRVPSGEAGLGEGGPPSMPSAPSSLSAPAKVPRPTPTPRGQPEEGWADGGGLARLLAGSQGLRGAARCFLTPGGGARHAPRLWLWWRKNFWPLESLQGDPPLPPGWAGGHGRVLDKAKAVRGHKSRGRPWGSSALVSLGRLRCHARAPPSGAPGPSCQVRRTQGSMQPKPQGRGVIAEGQEDIHGSSTTGVFQSPRHAPGSQC